MAGSRRRKKGSQKLCARGKAKADGGMMTAYHRGCGAIMSDRRKKTRHS